MTTKNYKGDNKNMKKALALILVAVMLLGVIPFASAEETVKITWATWALSEEALNPIYMSMIETFMEKYPNVEIETVTYPYAQYLEQLLISVAGGNAPTFAHIKADWAKQFYDTGRALALDDVMSEELLADYYPKILEGATMGGKIIAAPWFNTPSALYYNKNLLAQAGIENPPTTWDELIEDEYKVAALGADANGNKIYGTVLPNAKGEYGASFISMPALWANGGGYGKDENENVKIDGEGNAKAFEQLKQLYADGISPNGSNTSESMNLFAQGLVGFLHNIQTATGTFASASPKGEEFKNDYGVIPMPAPGTGYLTEHYLMFFDNGKELTEAEKEAYSNLIDWFSGEPVLKILYDNGMGKIPDRATVAQLPMFTTEADEITKVFVESAANCTSLPVSDPKFTTIDEYLLDAFGELASTNKDAQTVLDDLTEKVADLY